MLRRILVCSLLCLAPPAHAGDRDPVRVPPATRGAEAVLIHVDSHGVLNADSAATFGRRKFEGAVRLPGATLDLRSRASGKASLAPVAISLPAGPRIAVLRVADLPATPLYAFGKTTVAAQDWRLVAGESSRDPKDLSFADRSALQGLRGFPRVRRSALDTMLVLRIDGQEESPTFSVGGGVAAAVWNAIPHR